MTTQWSLSPWIAEHCDRVSFALQVFPNDTKTDPTKQLLAAGRLAEDLGFDAFFFGDHPAWGLECWVHMAALAVMTERIRLGINVACIGYRHPVMTARLAADLDNLSNGRLILGLGIGWDANEFANLGLPFPPARERQAALEETITIMRGVWDEDRFSFQGRYFSTTKAHVMPPPVQRPHLPIMIAGGGEKVTLRQVAQYADACNLVMYGGDMISAATALDDIRRKLAVLQRHCEALGRPFDTVLRTHQTGWLILGEDEARVQAKLKHYFPAGLEQRYSGPWRSFVFAGTPEDAISYYQSLVEVGIQYFIAETLDATDQETIRLLAEQVVPKVKPSREA
jgi:alkanesulfonate monooxygenase SsuD/methylene tetrahydromethanopterin reductase-like flavin-dependent oxidoreductase (luciferase family)